MPGRIKLRYSERVFVPGSLDNRQKTFARQLRQIDGAWCRGWTWDALQTSSFLAQVVQEGGLNGENNSETIWEDCAIVCAICHSWSCGEMLGHKRGSNAVARRSSLAISLRWQLSAQLSRGGRVGPQAVFVCSTICSGIRSADYSMRLKLEILCDTNYPRILFFLDHRLWDVTDFESDWVR